mgnify:CR=1 FL=1
MVGTGSALDERHGWIAKFKDLSATVEMTGIGTDELTGFCYCSQALLSPSQGEPKRSKLIDTKTQ